MNWFERVEAAEARGEFTWDDVQDAGCWSTCAVGENAEEFMRLGVLFHPVMGPMDEALNGPGLAFMNAVELNDFKRAKDALNDIEIFLNQRKKAKGIKVEG